MSAEIKTSTINRKRFKDAKALEMESQGYDAAVALSSGKTTTLCYRSSTTGRLTYLSGSVALYLRHDDYREGR